MCRCAGFRTRSRASQSTGPICGSQTGPARVGRLMHAGKRKQAERWVRKPRTWAGRIVRDIERKTSGEPDLAGARAFVHRSRQAASGAEARRQEQTLCPPRSRGRMHRQGQGADALRIRGQGVDRGDQRARRRRPVRARHSGASRTSLRRPHPERPDRSDRASHRRDRGPRRRRQGRSRARHGLAEIHVTQSPGQRSPTVERELRKMAADRAGHRPRQVRRPARTQLPRSAAAATPSTPSLSAPDTTSASSSPG